MLFTINKCYLYYIWRLTLFIIFINGKEHIMPASKDLCLNSQRFGYTNEVAIITYKLNEDE